METAHQLLRTWREAADDLGIEVEPFGDAVLVLGFGSAAGLLCGVLETREESSDCADRPKVHRHAERLGLVRWRSTAAVVHARAVDNVAGRSARLQVQARVALRPLCGC